MAKGAAERELKRPRAKRPALPLGSPCPNCATPLQGRWCHACGQLADDFHRPLESLAGEAISSVTSVDGRLVRTIPWLFIRPGRLTREYVEGKRVGQVSPLRLFLIAVVVLFLAANVKLDPDDETFTDMTAITLASAMAGMEEQAAGQKVEGARIVRDQAKVDAVGPAVSTMARWSHIAFLFTPLVIAALAALMLRRRPYFHDHLVFALHSVTVQFLILSLYLLLGKLHLVHQELALLLLPAHLVPHLMGAYGLGVFGAVWRTLVLLVGLALLLFSIFTALLVVGISVLL